MDAAGEEGGGVVIGPALQVLRQAKEGGAAIGGVKHGGQRGRQALQDLCRVGDPVPEAGDRFEGVVHSQGWIAEMFKLLQDRVGQAGDENSLRAMV